MLLAFSVALLFVDPAALIKGKTPVDLNVTGALPFFLINSAGILPHSWGR